MRLPSEFTKHFDPRTLLLLERDIDWRITGRWTLYAAVVGVLTAFAALGFVYLVGLVTDLVLAKGAGYLVPLPGGEAASQGPFDLERTLSPVRRWLLPVLPALGGLLAGLIVFKLAPEAEGHGTDAVIRAFHYKKGYIAPRVPFVKAVASALTIGTGGSAGREGPIAQIGAGLASIVSERFKLSDRERRILMVAGVAAGIGSLFRSPLGGAIFAVEVLYREDIETEALMPSVIAGITGYSVFSGLSESGSIFTTPEFRFVSPLELLPLLLFAMVCAVAGIFFVKVFHGAKARVFEPMPLPPWLKPAIGGLLVGGIAYGFPAVLGSSYGWLQAAIDGSLPVAIMALLAFSKIFTTSLTIGSGGSGGVFAPSLVIGGMLGGVFGNGLQVLAPNLVSQPEAYVMIGMATFFAAVANVPLATTIMISELTGSYTLLMPLLLSCVVVHVTARRWSLYTEQVRTHNDSPAHRLNLMPDLLSTVRVRSVIEQPVHYHTLVPSHTLPDVLSVFSRTREMVLPVVQLDTVIPPGQPPYTGLVLLEDVQALLTDESVRHVLVVADMQVPFAYVRLDDPLNAVLDTFAETQYPELPVINERGLIVGFIRQNQVINEYNRAYIRWKAEQEVFA